MSELTMIQPASQVISKSFVSNEYNLYLHNEISSDGDAYLEHFAVYHQAGPDDLIRLWIQSPGGSVSVGNQYIQHMNRCPATIIAVVGMGTASEGTAICLAADDWEVDDMSTFLVHGFSYGAYGHEAQVYNTATFNKKLNERSLRNTYSGLLTELEILEALKGVDLLFDGEELIERLALFKEYRDNQPCNCGQLDCPQNQRLAALEEQESFDDMPTIDEIVEQAVTKALIAYDKQKDEAAKKLADQAVAEAEDRISKSIDKLTEKLSKGFEVADDAKITVDSPKFIVDKKYGKKTVEELDEIKETVADREKKGKKVTEISRKSLNFVQAWLTGDKQKLQVLVEGTGARGGFLVPDDYADMIIEDMIDIADDGSNDFMTIVKGDIEYEAENKEVTNRSRLRVDTRKFYLQVPLSIFLVCLP